MENPEMPPPFGIFRILCFPPLPHPRKSVLHTIFTLYALYFYAMMIAAEKTAY